MAGEKGARKKKAGQIDIPNSPWTPQGGPRSKYVLFPLFSLCTARPGVYFQIFVWPKAIVRNARWEPLVGVEPPRPLLSCRQGECSSKVAFVRYARDSISCLLCLSFLRICMHMLLPWLGRDRFPSRKLVQLSSEIDRCLLCGMPTCGVHASHSCTCLPRARACLYVRCDCRGDPYRHQTSAAVRRCRAGVRQKRCLSAPYQVGNYLIKQARREACAACTCLRRELYFCMFFSKPPICLCVLDANLASCVLSWGAGPSHSPRTGAFCTGANARHASFGGRVQPPRPRRGPPTHRPIRGHPPCLWDGLASSC